MSRLCAVVVVIVNFFVRIFLLFSCSERKVSMTEIQRLRDRIGLVHTGDLESPDVDLRVSFGESSVVLGRGEWRMKEWHKNEEGTLDMLHIETPNASLFVKAEDLFFHNKETLDFF